MEKFKIQDVPHLAFPVRKVPVKDILSKNWGQASGITHAIVAKENKIVHFCSEDYGLVTNQFIIESFMRYSEENNVPIQITGSNFRDARFYINVVILDHPAIIGGKKDVVFPSIRLQNSYNGTLRYSFNIQAWRRICGNGMHGFVTEKAFRMLHTPQAADGLAVERSMSLFLEYMAEEYEDTLEIMEELTEYPVKDIPLRIEEVSDATEFPIALRDLAIERAKQEMKQYGLQATDWLIYNALNYQLNHNADNLLGRKADNLDKAVLDYLMEY